MSQSLTSLPTDWHASSQKPEIPTSRSRGSSHSPGLHQDIPLPQQGDTLWSRHQDIPLPQLGDTLGSRRSCSMESSTRPRSSSDLQQLEYARPEVLAMMQHPTPSLEGSRTQRAAYILDQASPEIAARLGVDAHTSESKVDKVVQLDQQDQSMEETRKLQQRFTDAPVKTEVEELRGETSHSRTWN